MKSLVANFNVLIVAFESAQVGELMRFISWTRWVALSAYSRRGFTRITELSSFRIVTAPRPLKYRRTFKLLGLWIEIVSNLKIVDFLDVTLNLYKGTFKPFSKSNSTPIYIILTLTTQDRYWSRFLMPWTRG